MYKKLDETALEAILEAGIEEFARCGFQPASIADVAKKAGVSVGVIYKYYNDNVIISKFKSRNQGMVYRIFIIAHRSFDIYFMY